DLLERRRAEELIVRRNGLRLLRSDERTLRRIGRRVGDRLAHVLEGETEPRERDGVDLHAHRGLLTAADEDLTDALHLRDFLRKNGVRRFEDGGERERVARQRGDEDR